MSEPIRYTIACWKTWANAYLVSAETEHPDPKQSSHRYFASATLRDAQLWVGKEYDPPTSVWWRVEEVRGSKSNAFRVTGSTPGRTATRVQSSPTPVPPLPLSSQH